MLSFLFHLCSAGHKRGEGKKNAVKKAEQMQHADGKLPRMSNVGLASSWKLAILREPLQTLQQDPHPLAQESRMRGEPRYVPAAIVPTMGSITTQKPQCDALWAVEVEEY